MEEALRQNLERVLSELAAYSPTAGPLAGPWLARCASPNPTAPAIAREIPLAHSGSLDAFVGICSAGALRSAEFLDELGVRRLQRDPDLTVELLLGTADDVFTYAAPFRRPSTTWGLLFQVGIEAKLAATSIATPFDSGATRDFLRPNDSEDDQVRFLRRHELPVPGYRRYLERTLALLFATPWHYVDGAGPDMTSPVQDLIVGGDERRWTFEVRFRRQLSLSGTVLAAFLPNVLYRAKAVQPILDSWESEGVDVLPFVAAGAYGTDFSVLRRESITYLKGRLKA